MENTGIPGLGQAARGIPFHFCVRRNIFLEACMVNFQLCAVLSVPSLSNAASLFYLKIKKSVTLNVLGTKVIELYFTL